MEFEEFLKPKLVGGRFDGHSIPLEFLRNLAVLNEMIQEGAKAEFLKANPTRQRSPRGFADDFTLVLSGIEGGSVTPVITLFFAMSGLFPDPNLVFYQRARDSIVGAIKAVNEGRSPAEFLTQSSLAYFKNFGDRLRDGEAIEFPTGDPDAPARFTKEVRRTLLLSLPGVQEVAEEVELRGLVDVTKHSEKKFVIKLADGSEVPGSMTRDHYDNIIAASSGYQKGVKLYLQGVGARDRQGKLIRIETIERSDVLDAFDSHGRIDEIRVLKDGWLDGEGIAPDSKGLDWLETSIREHFTPRNPRLPLPRIFPAPGGQIMLEWKFDSKAASLEIDLGGRMGYWHVLDLSTKDDSDEDLDLGQAAGWDRLAEQLAGIGGDEAK